MAQKQYLGKLYSFARAHFSSSKKGILGPSATTKKDGLLFGKQQQQQQPPTIIQSTPLKQVIQHELQTTGLPMSLARFMELGLMHPEHGYYSTKDKIFNKGGDFTTSPEISQMFGEMLGIWIMTAIRNNYMKVDDTSGEASGEVSSVNLVEIGPGSGLMMSDIIRTLAQFTGNLKNFQLNLIEASPNLISKQQERLLADLKGYNINMFLTYDMDLHKRQSNPADKEQSSQIKIERFYNTEQNFSIAWFPTLKDYYNYYLETQIKKVQSITGGDKSKKLSKHQVAQLTSNPVLILAHELYDALPVHQFEYTTERQWQERMVHSEGNTLVLKASEKGKENVDKVLKPEKLFAGQSEIKVGDTIEICPSAVSLTQEIMSLIEVSRGAALIVDYGEDHAFSNSFRGIKEHKVYKEFSQIAENVGNIDLTTYVNFNQIKKIAESNANLLVNGPMPQGLFLECMGITMRLEILQKAAKTQAQRKLLEDSYIRLCHPEQMGEIYKMLFLGHKEVGDIFPFLGEETEKKQNTFG
ncbi:hypothetical protein FGO68_gene2308 [Halteria grandinella]|uniref:Protein arginine methyltransferase NDUFAF7 n=1 Tax=Halteria grandinella TaxID=5974 RepID=A0A8J8T385_HALGN|nr:hypothetical protein FGO68_gene2308 [Halteria grandinella]